MKTRVLLLSLLPALGLVSCLSSCNYQSNTDFTYQKSGGSEMCRYNHAENKCRYHKESNGKLVLTNGAVQQLNAGQYVDVQITESGKRYHYGLTNEAGAVSVKSKGGPLTEADQARLKRVLDHVQARKGK